MEMKVQQEEMNTHSKGALRRGIEEGGWALNIIIVIQYH
jgi:hypothetical protein